MSGEEAGGGNRWGEVQTIKCMPQGVRCGIIESEGGEGRGANNLNCGLLFCKLINGEGSSRRAKGKTVLHLQALQPVLFQSDNISFI